MLIAQYINWRKNGIKFDLVKFENWVATHTVSNDWRRHSNIIDNVIIEELRVFTSMHKKFSQLGGDPFSYKRDERTQV